MKCCAACIGDNGLLRTFPSFTSEHGNCDYCRTTNVLIVQPAALSDLIAPLIRIYEPSEEGRLLVQCLREDWGMFEHERMDDARAAALLAEILDDGEMVRKCFTPSASYETDSLSRWEILREELMYGNRYFPSTEIRQERLIELLDLLKTPEVELPTQWHRARLMTHKTAFSIGDMGAPPKEIAKHGRANPAGIPYLYLCSEPRTAVAEIRPHTGEQACIATFTTSQNLSVVDLRNPRHTISPLDFGDEEKIGYLRSDLRFLTRLGDELTRPVIPRSAAIDYVPSQYLCEFIKKCGYDGLIYSSSVGDGINMALFDQQNANTEKVTVHAVKRVFVEIGEPPS